MIQDEFFVFVSVFFLLFLLSCSSPSSESTPETMGGEPVTETEPINQPTNQPTEATTMETTLKLSSSAFVPNGQIPSKYTCDGANINPPLKFENVPAGAKSLVLIVDDPDIPDFVKQKYGIQVWDHWIVFNIPPTVTEIAEGAEGKALSGIQGKNTGGRNAYGGPCPPDREHRYFFKLYALDTTLNLPAGASKAEVEKAMERHIVAQAELVGRYERRK